MIDDSTLLDKFEITITPTARQKIVKFAKKENTANPLRLAVSGGGCSGFQYILEFDKQRDDDVVRDFGDFRVVIDPASVKLFNGMELDYIETLESVGFKFSNPNAKSKCACGMSVEF